MGTLLPHQDVSAGTLSLKKTIKKTTKMPRKYREYARMPKGWRMEEVVDNEVEDVWAKQMKALSDSTIPGRLTRSASRLIRAQSLPSPAVSK